MDVSTLYYVLRRQETLPRRLSFQYYIGLNITSFGPLSWDYSMIID